MKNIFYPLFLLMAFAAGAQTITTVGGCGIGDDSLATKAELAGPMKAVMDLAGNTYIVDAGYNRVRKIDVNGVITTFAGTGDFGNTGDGGPAIAAHFEYLYSIAVDKFGNVYIADLAASCVRMVNSSGIIYTVAGTGTAGYNGDNIAAISAQLSNPTDIDVDSSGNLYIADCYNYRVRKVDISGTITTVAGNGSIGPSGLGGPATAAAIGYPNRIAVDKKGDLFIGTFNAWHILKVDTSGNINSVAGTGTTGFSGDGGPAISATFATPNGIAVDAIGNVYFSDALNYRVRKIDTSGIISTYAGKNSAGFAGDGGPADSALLNFPEGLSIDLNMHLLIADWNNNCLRRIAAGDTISTFAGRNGMFADGYPAVNAEMSQVSNICTDVAGNVYLADISNERIRKISPSGIITTAAGSGISRSGASNVGDGGPATAAGFYYPSAVAVDAAGNMYICEQGNQRIRKVNTTGIISTIAGNGTFGYTGDGGPATSSELSDPTGIAVDRHGNIFICDNNNHCIRKIDTNGTIHTIAGTGTPGFNGNNIAATSAQLAFPDDVAVDTMGNVFISDQGTNTIRYVDTNGIIHLYAGSGNSGFSGDGGIATNAKLADPRGIKVDNYGNLYIADYGNNRIRMVNANHIIQTIAGSGTPGFSGDGGSALSANMNGPSGIAIDASFNLYITDANNFRIRKVNIAYLAVDNSQSIRPDIYLYPNPAKDEIHILTPWLINNLAIYNTQGQCVLSQTCNTNDLRVSLQGLANAVYFARINGVTVLKFVKE